MPNLVVVVGHNVGQLGASIRDNVLNTNAIDEDGKDHRAALGLASVDELRSYSPNLAVGSNVIGGRDRIHVCFLQGSSWSGIGHGMEGFDHIVSGAAMRIATIKSMPMRRT